MRRAWAIVALVLGLWLVVNVLLMVAARAADKRRVKATAAAYDAQPWQRWMAYVPPTTLLRDLVLPGTHDSGARELALSGITLLPQPFEAALAYSLVAGPTVTRFSVTQDLTLFQQCLAGMRMFDLRVALAEDGDWWCWHGFKTQRLADALDEFERFSISEPTEALLLWVRIENSLTPSTRATVDALFDPHAARLMTAPAAALAAPVGALGGRWLVFANEGLDTLPSARYGDYDINTMKWFDSFDVRTQLANLTAELAAAPAKPTRTQNVRATKFFVQQWILTPQPIDFALGGVWNAVLWGAARSLRTKALEFNDALDAYLTQHADDVKAKVNGIWGDFFQYSSLRKHLVTLNGIQFPSS